METKRELPFDCVIMDDTDVEVKNPYSDNTCMLPPDAVAVYDVIKGAEILGKTEIVQKGLQWMRTHFPYEYMILLD